MEYFDKIMEFIGLWEWANKPDGQYTNDPVDPGGETKFGISKRAHPDLDIKNLTLEQAKDIYLKQYWLPLQIVDMLPLGVQALAMNTSVNMGTPIATAFLDQTKEFYPYLALVKARYFDILARNPIEAKYAGGWRNRLVDLQKKFT